MFRFVSSRGRDASAVSRLAASAAVQDARTSLGLSSMERLREALREEMGEAPLDARES